MLKGTVTRNDAVWQGHPDVTLFNDELIIVFRESDRHLTKNPTRLYLIIKNKSFSEPVEIASSPHRLNCPRLTVIDDTLWLICDIVEKSTNYFSAENDPTKTKIHLWNTKDARNWNGPFVTNIAGIVPDKICKTNDGFLIAAHTFENDNLVQNVWHTTDLYGEWVKYPLCHLEGYNICEASVVKFEQKYVCLMRENSGLGLPAFVSVSSNGLEWREPKQTRIFGCHRPVCGVLKSGNLLTTYRESSHSFRPGFWAKNTFACLTSKNSVLKDFTDSIILPLDHDQSKRCDSGYTGWVQMPDNSIFIVNYVTADAPKPYIRWYSIFEEEF